MENTKAIWNKIKQKKYVSFDIFDTLIKRNVSNPKDIFTIVEFIYNSKNGERINNFVSKRKEAERFCREKSEREEITLSEIYKVIDYPISISTQLMEIEINTEVLFCQTNLAILDIYQKCINEGKTVVLISDMYLPEEIINKILFQNGVYNYYKLYLSSSIKLQKGTGNLYEYVLNDLGISGSEMAHVGDGFITDFIRPIQHRIKGVHIKRNHNNLTFIDDDVLFHGNSLIWPFVNNNISKYSCSSEIFRLGYETFGPLIIGFSSWIHKKLKEKDARKAYFLARDMYLFVNIYSRLFPEDEIVYLEVSRRSLRRSFIKHKGDLKEVLNTLGRNKHTVEDICKSVGIGFEEYASSLQNLKIRSNELFSKIVDSPVDYDNLQKYIFNKLQDEEDLTEEYLRQKGMFESYQNIIVDIGWHGTIQNMIEGITGVPIKGLYLGNTKRENYKDIDSEGYWFNSKNERDTINHISIVGILEVALFPNVGTTTGYKRKGDIILPTHCKSEAYNFAVIEEFQKGALQCVEDFACFIKDELSGIGLTNIFDMTAESCMHAYINMAYRPSLKVAKLFGDLNYEDNRMMKLASPRRITTYFFNPSLLLNDYRESKWKIGFIKQLFPMLRRPDVIDLVIKKINNR